MLLASGIKRVEGEVQLLSCDVVVLERMTLCIT